MNEKTCGYCKHFAQGAHCSFCANEKQTDNKLKQYAYYPFSCELFEQGIHQRRIDFMNDDFKEKVATVNKTH